jgi:uncharacterized protein
MAIPQLLGGLFPNKVHFGIQSNLWLLTEELCQLFKEHKVSLATSLDGPQIINDAQRGQGYFQKTMKGIQLARSHGLNVAASAPSQHNQQNILTKFLTSS